jgi:hypothetical protein
VTPAQRRSLLTAALGFTLLEPRAHEFGLLQSWISNWTGIGHIVVGMKRHGYKVSLGDHGGQWIAVFYEGHGGYEPLRAAGTAQAPTPWRAVQRAAWEALNKQTT